MRIGSSIILLNGYCYQSYNWRYLRPLGKLQNAIDFLEAYECDEITIIRPIRDIDTIESFQKDIDEISKLKCMTPLSFGGGLRDIKHIDMLHNLPIERLVFSSAFIHTNIDIIHYATNLYGHQAIQCMLPFTLKNNTVQIFSSSLNKFIPYDSINVEFIQEYANEIILLDIQNEGLSNKFTDRILKKIKIKNSKLIISGGVGKETIGLCEKQNIASILIDNKVLHEEYSIKGYRHV
ncbi:MAG: imidazole glycerol phosphate synthase subunit HisF [Sulfurimonas sp.]|jgi:imidazole glycerol phosphate synthase subunit HisF|uniref:HisA/HisF-related TIM barrel protein n=1 Tax=Sulfurimonas sp. TaxID=2022749 RepID=UPI0039E4A233